MIEEWERTTALSAVGFAAVEDGCDVDGLLVSLIEEHLSPQRRRKPVSGDLSFFTSPVRLAK